MALGHNAHSMVDHPQKGERAYARMGMVSLAAKMVAHLRPRPGRASIIQSCTGTWCTLCRTQQALALVRALELIQVE